MNSIIFCHKQLARLAIPNFLTTLSVPLLGIVDTALAGHMAKVEDLAALALATILFQLIYWLFGFLRMGTTGSIAQSQNEGIIRPEAIQILWNSSLLALAIALSLVFFQTPIFNLYYYISGADPLTTKLSTSYSEIRIWAAPATLLNYVIHGWYLGIQNPWIPLALTTLIQILNIILNFLLAYGCNMGVEGLALATLIAQWIGFIIGFVHLYRNHRIARASLIIDYQKVLSVLHNNVDLLIRTLLLMISIHSLSWFAARLGPSPLAASAIILQLLGLLSYGLDGIALSCESLVGQAVGLKDKNQLWKVIRTGFIWGLISSLLFSMIFWFGLPWLISIFTDKQYLIDICLQWKVFIVIAPLVCFVCFIWDGIYVGALRTQAMRNSMFFSTFIVYLPSTIILLPTFGMNGLWSAYLLFMASRGITLSLWAKREMSNSITRISKSDSPANST